LQAPRASAAATADVAVAPAAAKHNTAPSAAPATNLATDESEATASPPVGRPPRPPAATSKDIKAKAFPIWAVAAAVRLLKAALSAPAAAADGCSRGPAAPAGGAATSAARHAASPAATSLAAGVATLPVPAAAADGRCSRPVALVAPAGGAVTSAAPDATSSATTGLAAGAPTSPAPAAD